MPLVFTPPTSLFLPCYAEDAVMVMATLTSPPKRRCKRSYDIRVMQYVDIEAKEGSSEDEDIISSTYS